MNTQHALTDSGKPLNPPKPPAKPHMLLWIDTETTGISRTNAKLLEIGMIVTSMDGIEEHDRFICPVRPDKLSLYDIDPKVLRMYLDNGLLDTVMDVDTNEFGYANVARNLYEWMQNEATEYELHPAHQPPQTRPQHLPAQRYGPRPQPLPKPRRHPPSPRLHPPRPQRLRQLPRHHASRTPRHPIMHTGKRIPATLTAILAILALTACGETPKGDGQGNVNNPDPGYVRWYELPDGSAAVRCFSDSGGASCDWGHIELRDKQ